MSEVEVVEKRKANIIYSKSGNGYISPKLGLSLKWLREMGLSPEDKGVVLEFTGSEIIIKKQIQKNDK